MQVQVSENSRFLNDADLKLSAEDFIIIIGVISTWLKFEKY